MDKMILRQYKIDHSKEYQELVINRFRDFWIDHNGLLWIEETQDNKDRYVLKVMRRIAGQEVPKRNNEAANFSKMSWQQIGTYNDKVYYAEVSI